MSAYDDTHVSPSRKKHERHQRGIVTAAHSSAQGDPYSVSVKQAAASRAVQSFKRRAAVEQPWRHRGSRHLMGNQPVEARDSCMGQQRAPSSDEGDQEASGDYLGDRN